MTTTSSQAHKEQPAAHYQLRAVPKSLRADTLVDPVLTGCQARRNLGVAVLVDRTATQ